MSDQNVTITPTSTSKIYIAQFHQLEEKCIATSIYVKVLPISGVAIWLLMVQK